jgi:protein arginine N-methyltransferase 5
LAENNESPSSTETGSRADPIIPPLTPDDTGLFPSPAVNTYTAYISPWIDLCSTNPLIASISRQVLNLEINYANFCGVRSIIIAGPTRDASRGAGNQALAQYSRAVQEALTVGSPLTILIHMPMHREATSAQHIETLSSLVAKEPAAASASSEHDVFSAWASWHHVRSTCNYSLRLYVGMFYLLLFLFIGTTILQMTNNTLSKRFKSLKSSPTMICNRGGLLSLCII